MKMLKKVLLIGIIASWNITISQEKPIVKEKSKSGTLELGMRNTLSLFENDGHTGIGVGGQFRLWVSKKLNTEWYADYIKTDGSLIKNIDTDKKSYEIVKAIVNFSSNMYISTVAEFVHSKSVQKIVEELGINYSQGYYFSEPSAKIETSPLNS